MSARGLRRGGALLSCVLVSYVCAEGAYAQPEVPSPAPEAPTPEAPAPVEPTESAGETTEEETTEDVAPEPAEDDEDEIMGVSTSEPSATTEHATDEPQLGLRAWVTPADVFRAGGTVAILTERDLARVPLDDPNAVLTRAPGVYVRTEDGFGLRPNIGMRGVNPERSGRITLMEDGVLFGPAPYAAPAAYYFPLMMRMTGVEVAKGPAAILYGPSTVGGAINFRSREVPETPEGSVELSYGMYRSRRAHLWYGTSTRHAGFLFEATDLGTDGFKDIDYTQGPTGFSRGEYVLRGFVRNDPGAHVHHRLELRTGFSFERSYETYLGLSTSDFRADPYRRYVATARDRMQWKRYEVALTHRMQVGRELELETTLYRHDFHRVWNRFQGFVNGPNAFEVLLAPGSPANQPYYDILTGAADSDVDPDGRTSNSLIIVTNDRTFVSQGIQSVLRFDRERDETRATGHHLELGVRLHYDSIVRLHTGHGYRVQDRALVPDGQPDIIEADNHGDALAFAAHAAYVLEHRALRVMPGVRTELIRTELFDYGTLASQRHFAAVVLPGMGVSYALTPWLATFVGAHRGFSPVAPGQSVGVKAESSIAYEAGFRVLDEESGLSAELSGFFNDYRNLMLSCSGAGGCPDAESDSQFNAGSANIGGIEAAFAHEFELPGDFSLPVRASYTFTMARFRHVASTAIGTPGYEEATDGAYVPYIPTNQWQAQVGVEGPRFDATVLMSYVGRMRENAALENSESLFTDAYVMLDVAGHYQLTDHIRLMARGENLLNSHALVSRRPFGARPVKPLTVIAGFEIPL